MAATAHVTVTVIGPTTRVNGRISGPGDLEVQGFVEGDIAMGGDVTVDASGMVGANVRGRRILVRGAVRGDLAGDEAVVLEEGARVVGDTRAPRISIAQGALVRGHVEIGNDAPGASTPARGHSAVRATLGAAAAARSQSPAAKVALPPPRAVAKPDPGPSQVAKASKVAPSATPAQGPTTSVPRRPPPPVVPALKKLKGAIVRKKER